MLVVFAFCNKNKYDKNKAAINAAISAEKKNNGRIVKPFILTIIPILNYWFLFPESIRMKRNLGIPLNLMNKAPEL